LTISFSLSLIFPRAEVLYFQKDRQAHVLETMASTKAQAGKPYLKEDEAAKDVIQ